MCMQINGTKFYRNKNKERVCDRRWTLCLIAHAQIERTQERQLFMSDLPPPQRGRLSP